jgi:protein-ribulosamine 3-kinase
MIKMHDTDERPRQIIEQSHHAEMVLGEYESQKILGYYLPDNVSIALAYGTLEQDTSQSFLLTPFRDMEDITPNPTQLVEVLERLHTSSVSENGKFGFHVATFNGHVPLVNDWTNTWEEWYSRQLQSDIHWLDGCIGKDADFNRVVAEFVDKVVPRLLRPLQTGGRNIKPTLVHGDIWHGNAQIDMASQKVILFDSCCCYAHNERKL